MVAAFLLEHGAELRDAADSGATGLHGAAEARWHRQTAPRSRVSMEETTGGADCPGARGHGLSMKFQMSNFIRRLEALSRRERRYEGIAGMDWQIKDRPVAEKSASGRGLRRYGATA